SDGRGLSVYNCSVLVEEVHVQVVSLGSRAAVLDRTAERAAIAAAREFTDRELDGRTLRLVVEVDERVSVDLLQLLVLRSLVQALVREGVQQRIVRIAGIHRHELVDQWESLRELVVLDVRGSEVVDRIARIGILRQSSIKEL